MPSSRPRRWPPIRQWKTTTPKPGLATRIRKSEPGRRSCRSIDLDVDSQIRSRRAARPIGLPRDWITSARRTDLADQLAGILASGSGTQNSTVRRWRGTLRRSRGPLREIVSAQRPVRVPKVVTLYDGTKRFGRAVPKILVPPGRCDARIAPCRQAATPGVKSASSGHAERPSALQRGGRIGTLRHAGYVKQGRRREKSAGGFCV